MINRDKITLLFGYLLNTRDNIPINTILIVAKNYIFHTASLNQKPFIEIYRKKLLKVYFDQCNLCVLNDTEETFNKNWLKFQPLLKEIQDTK